MDLPPGSPEPSNVYALVTYLPEPLGSFLNQLRAELVPGCDLRAHVTVLPPRPLASEQEAWEQIRRETRRLAPVMIELGEVEVFPETQVIFLSLRQGSEELHQMHEQLSRNALAFVEPFAYHPHITLAQGLAPEAVSGCRELAARRWGNYCGPRSFQLTTMTFVRSADRLEWLDLGQVELGGALVKHP